MVSPSSGAVRLNSAYQRGFFTKLRINMLNGKEKERIFFDQCVEDNVNLSFYDSKFTLELMSNLEQKAFELIGDLKNKKILYYGCGVNYPPVKYFFKKKAEKIYMIDISPKSIEYNVNRVRQLGMNDKVFPLVMDCESLTFTDNKFDIVFGKAILHHLNVNKSIKEIHRVLKPNGQAVFIEPLGMNPFINIYRRLTPQLRTPEEKPFERQELNLIKSSNFSSVDYNYYSLLSIIGILLEGFVKVSPNIRFEYNTLAKLDSLLLEKLPFLSKYCWNIVILLTK